MITTKRLLTFCTLGAFALSQGAGAVVIDDFESYPTGTIRDTTIATPPLILADTVWDPNGSGLPAILEQDGNNFLAFDWDDGGYRGAHRDLGPGIGAADTSTLFFRFRSTDERGNYAIGATDVDDPGTQVAGFPDFRAGVTVADDVGGSNGTYTLNAGATPLTTGLAEGTWYNLWLVIDNNTDTMDVYLNAGTSKLAATDKLNTAPVSFLAGTLDALDRFVVSGNGAVDNAARDAHVDDISLNAGAVAPTLLFQDNFERYKADTSVGTAGPWDLAQGGGGFFTVRDEGTATPFGATNQYLHINDNSSTSLRLDSPLIEEAHNAVTTLSFDFVEPDSVSGTAELGVGFAMDGGDLTSTGSRLRVSLNDGTIGATGGISGGDSTSYVEGTAYTLYIIFNDSGSDFDYAGGTVGAESADVWFEEVDSGNFIFAGNVDAVNSKTIAGYDVSFRVFGSSQQSMLVDNVELFAGAFNVPEPTSLALLGLGGLLLTRRRR